MCPCQTTRTHPNSAYVRLPRMPHRPSTHDVLFQASTGSVQYAPDKSAFVWKIKQLGGGREFLMRAHFGLPSVRGGMLLPHALPR